MIETAGSWAEQSSDSQEAISISGQAFSLAAPHYDSDQRKNRVARWSRARNLSILQRAFASGERVLELGCGTGEEAIYLARKGITVVATDAAPAMLGVLREKLEVESIDVRERVIARLAPAGELDALVSEFGRHSFDGAYSSFGPLNCEALLDGVAYALSELVRPGGRMVLSLINRFCLWESAWFLATGRPKAAARRWPGRTLATVRGEWQEMRIPVYYWSLGEIERAFGAAFGVTGRMALPWLLPPQYLDGLLKGRKRLFRLLAAVDKRLARIWPFYALGDHVLFELVRKPLQP